MITNHTNEQRYIVIDSHFIPVTEEVYRAYARPLWLEHKRMEREKRCRAENGNRCTRDCSTCKWVREGGTLSLDQLAETGYESPDSINIEEYVADKFLFEQLFAALNELTLAERDLICALFFHEKSERDVADKLGLCQKAVNKRRHKVLAKLRGLMLAN